MHKEEVNGIILNKVEGVKRINHLPVPLAKCNPLYYFFRSFYLSCSQMNSDVRHFQLFQYVRMLFKLLRLFRLLRLPRPFSRLFFR
jgi:hypothetical protein